MKSSFVARINGWVAPLLVSALFSLECYLDLKPFGTIPGMLLVFSVTAVAGLLIYLAGFIVLRNTDKAAFWTIIVMLTACFFSYILTVARDLPILRLENRRHVLMGIVCSWAILLAVLKWKGAWAQHIGRFNTVLLLVLIGYAGVRLPSPAPAPPAWGKASPRLQSSRSSPDIYYILLDGHTSPESLQRYWNYNASWFVDSLRDKGFHVISNARANFDSTAFCMATTFNMDLPPQMPPQWSGFSQAAYIMQNLANGHAKRALHEGGYEVIELSVFPGLGGRTPFYQHSSVVATTVPGLAIMKSPIGHAAEHFWVRQQGQSSIRAIEKLQEIAATPSTVPRFVYAHVLLPHNPYFFDRDGNPVLKGIGANYRDATKEDYLEQLIYLDRVLTNTVTKILASARQPPVIILQGDHGYRGLTGDEAKAAESLTILHALHLPPGIASAEPYPEITPVNTFRLLFNRYFGSCLPYAPDDSTPASVLAADAREVP